MRSLRGGFWLRTLTEDGEACVNIVPQTDASNARSTRCIRNWRSLDPVWKEAMFERSFATCVCAASVTSQGSCTEVLKLVYRGVLCGAAGTPFESIRTFP